ncbi:helix-turn-helix transcriptional regulator [Haladaptatus sp. NG-SE-30]
MRSHPALLVVLLSLLLVGTAIATGDSQQFGSTSLDSAAENQTRVNETAVNGTTIRIVPQPDGDARWNVSMEFALRNQNETAAFEKLGQEFEQGNTEVGFSTDLFRRIAQHVESETGREMKIRQIDRTYAVRNRTGTLYLSIVWTNFTRVEGDRLILRDAFLLDDGESTWLPSLSGDQRLVIHNPEGYRIQNSPNFGHTNRTIRVEGPTSLYPGEIDVTYVENSGKEEPKDEPLSLESIVLILLAIGTGSAGLYVLIQRRDDESDDDAPEERPAVSSEPEPEPESEPEDDDPNLELLSDEERVEYLLKQNGGRMKQAKIVTETNWSNAKVSQLLSSMTDEGRVDKLRIGRENLITLPDENVTDFDKE